VLERAVAEATQASAQNAVGQQRAAKVVHLKTMNNSIYQIFLRQHKSSRPTQRDSNPDVAVG
jgi:hypothetical protein